MTLLRRAIDIVSGIVDKASLAAYRDRFGMREMASGLETSDRTD